MPESSPPPDRPCVSIEQDRYARLRLIPWWDQDVLSRAKVIVVGAGALGNEILKNLALLGVGSILIVDFDEIEASNLSRSVLFAESDSGASKAQAAAEAVRKLNSDCAAYALNADVTCQVGAGVFRWADVVICGLDNREARLAVNQACWKVNRPWVDGATEGFQGVVRVFEPPDGVCYECTLSEQDQRLMSMRNSCGFIAREASRRGGVPTTPTTSAVIAGIQVQEALKLLHRKAELPNLIGRGFFFDGSGYDCFTIEYVRRDDCLSHETYDEMIESDLRGDVSCLSDVFHLAESRLAGTGSIRIDLPSEMITELRCSDCDASEPFFRLLDSTSEREAACPRCGKIRVPEVVTDCEPDAAFASVSLSQLGFGIMEIITARRGEAEVHIEISGDAENLLRT